MGTDGDDIRERIRIADPTTDAQGVAEIYDAAVTGSMATFEVEPPGPDEMARRMRQILDQTPWLVAEVGGHALRLGEPETGPDGVPREPTPIGMLDR
jgi:hypothetical protein